MTNPSPDTFEWPPGLGRLIRALFGSAVLVAAFVLALVVIIIGAGLLISGASPAKGAIALPVGLAMAALGVTGARIARRAGK